MRHPRRWRSIGLAFCASGIVASIAPFLLPAAMAGDGVRTALFAYGLVAVIFGAATAIWCHLGVRALDALARGEDVIAKWRIDADTWREFVAMNAKLNQEPGAPMNELSVRDEAPPGGIEVVVGKEAIEIDQSIHSLPRRGMPEITRADLISGTPDYIALQLYYPAGGHGAADVPYGPTRTQLRFPVAPRSWRDGRVVVAYFAVVLAFGLTSLCYGIWQVRTGKRSKRVAFAMLGLWTVLLLMAAWLR